MIDQHDPRRQRPYRPLPVGTSGNLRSGIVPAGRGHPRPVPRQRHDGLSRRAAGEALHRHRTESGVGRGGQAPPGRGRRAARRPLAASPRIPASPAQTTFAFSAPDARAVPKLSLHSGLASRGTGGGSGIRQSRTRPCAWRGSRSCCLIGGLEDYFAPGGSHVGLPFYGEGELGTPGLHLFGALDTIPQDRFAVARGFACRRADQGTACVITRLM